MDMNFLIFHLSQTWLLNVFKIIILARPCIYRQQLLFSTLEQAQ